MGKEKKLNDYNPKEVKKLNERVDALAELLGDLEKEVKEIKSKTYPGDIANAIREGFTKLAERGPIQASQPTTTPQLPELDFDIFSITWKQKGGAVAPANPRWGWAFAFTQDGGYHTESAKLVKYIERYGSYSADGYIVKLGGRDNKLLQLNKA